MKRLVALLMVFVMCSVCLCSCNKTNSTNENIGESNYYEYDNYETQPLTTGEPDKSVITKVKMTIKDYGDVYIDLYDNEAPITVANFKKLVKEGFYDGNPFHRLTQGAFSGISVLQGGSIDGSGMGGSDEEIKGEFIENGVENNISHVRGVISMARSDDPNSASSQFFICYDDDCVVLDKAYAGFGMITEGMDIIDSVVSAYASSDGNEMLVPGNQPVIEKMEIIE